MKKLLVILCIGLIGGQVFAQDELLMEEEKDPNAIIPPRHMLKRPRPEDHFWRQRVVNRIDLRETKRWPSTTPTTRNLMSDRGW